jgi:hypothetical protein
MFYLSVSSWTLTLIENLSVSSWTLTLIEREDDTRSWSNFLVYFSHNAMST